MGTTNWLRPAPQAGRGANPIVDKRAPESLLIEAVVSSLSERSQWATECVVQDRARIDVCVYHRGKLHGIEGKVTDWRRAIGQAYLNRYSVDYPYVALWRGNISEAVIQEATRFGIGIIEVQPQGTRIVLDAQEATPSPRVRGMLVQLCKAGQVSGGDS